MMSGRAIARVCCGLFLIEAALITNILAILLPQDEERIAKTDMEEESESNSRSCDEISEAHKDPVLLDHSTRKALVNLFSDVLSQNILPDSLAESPELICTCKAMESYMNELKMAS